MRHNLKKIAKKSILIILLCLALLQVLVLSARLFINTTTLKNKITSELAQRLNAQVAIDRLSLDLLGLPRIVLHDCSLVFKNAAEITVKSATLYPALLPLLTGKTVAGEVLLDGPDLRLHLTGDTQAAPAVDSSFDAQQRQAAKALADALKNIPAGSLYINNGAVGFIPPRGGPQLTIQNITAEITTSPDKLSLMLGADCRLWHELQLKAEFTQPSLSSPQTPEPFPLESRIGAYITGFDITAARAAADSLAGNSPAIKNIFDRIHSGTISRLSVNLPLPVTADSIKNGAVRLIADFDNTSIRLPETTLSVHNFSSHIQVGDGMIVATQLKALVGNSSIDNANLFFDAESGYAPKLIQADLQLDLAQLPELLRFIPAPGLKDELSLIRSPRGAARGACKIARKSNDYTMDMQIDSLNLTADYRGFPMPINIDKGFCHYHPSLLSFAHLSGRVGSATLSDISAEFSLADDGRFGINAAGAALDVQELHAILTSFSPTRDILQKIVLAGGKLLVKSFTLGGPITMPLQWTYELQAQATNITAEYAGIPGKIECSSGSLAVSQNVFNLSQAKLACLDSRIEGSITLEDYLSGITKAEVSASGQLGEPFLAKVFTDLQLPPELMIRAPATAKQVQCSWTRGGATEFSGDFIFGRTARAELALRNSKESFEIQKLIVRDAESNCTARIGFTESGITLSYAGLLTKATLDRILADNRFVRGWAKGDFTADLNKNTPLASTARGSMAWENAGYPVFDQFPVVVKRASVTAHGKSIKISSASVGVRDSAADVAGRIDFSKQGFILDMDITAERLDIDQLISAFKSDNASANNDTSGFWNMRLGGTARVAAPELALAGYTFAPCNLKMDFSNKLITITATNAMLCQIPIPASVRISPDFITVESRPAARKNDIEAVLKCLSQGKSIMTGSLDIQSVIKAHARPEALADSFTGNFSVKARNGRIYRSNLLTKILSFLSIRQLLTGGILNIAEKGYEYESLRINGDLEGQVLQVREAILISTSMNLVCTGSVNLKTKALDLEALATPFQILDYVLSKMPLIGSAFKKTVIGVPLYIGGTMDDPKLSPRAPTAVGKEVMKLATDVIQLPIKIIRLPGELIMPKQ